MKKIKPSFKEINYMFRPRKQIERKILIELFQKIQQTLNIAISEYQYIGLGSIYYYDFLLFHKYLNIRDMISLDKEDSPERFELNKPFGFIKFKNITTTEFLAKNELNKKSFIWFDYDSSLIHYKYKSFFITESIINDIRLIANKSKKLDLFILTVNININESLFDSQRVRRAFIHEYDEYLSDKYKEDNKISFKEYPLIIQNIIINIFRNNEQFQPVKFRKLFSFIYKDGATMYTIGGIFSEDNNFQDELDKDIIFLNTEENGIIDIDVPLLTYYEKMILDKKIDVIEKNLDSLNEEKIIEMLGFEIDPSELKSYLNYYRYYPQYYEGII